jgi:hypothetical protein
MDKDRLSQGVKGIVLLLLPVVLAACSLFAPSTPPPPGFIETIAYQTAISQASQSAFETAVARATDLTRGTRLPPAGTPPAPGGTPGPSTGTATTGTVEATPPDCYRVAFLEDVTIPDGTTLHPGEPFTKIWRIQNSGTCTWSADYALAFVNGAQMDAPATIPLGKSVAPGENIDLSANMLAPRKAGTYQGNWKLRAPDGTQFGPGTSGTGAIWVKIAVQGASARYPNAVVDFSTEACAAKWTTNVGSLGGCSNQEDFANGSVQVVNGPKLADGTQSDEPGIVTIPPDGANGLVQAAFPALAIQSGDHLLGTLACLDQSPACDVTFELRYQEGSNQAITLGRWQAKATSTPIKLNIDLSAFGGRDIAFIFSVSNNGSSQDDRAVWLGLRIE